MHSWPLSSTYASDCAKSSTSAQLAVLWRLLAYVFERQRLLPLDRDRCVVIAVVRSQAELSALDTVLAEHFNITELGRMPRQEMLCLNDTVRFKPAADVPEEYSRGNGGVTSALAKRYQDEVMPISANAQRQRIFKEAIESDRKWLLDHGVPTGKRITRAELDELIRVTKERPDEVTPALLGRYSRTRTRADLLLIPNTEEEKERDTRTRVTPALNGHTPAGAAVRAMKEAGMPSGNPTSPRLQRLLDAGITAEELANTTRDCVAAGKPLNFNYILAVVEGERREAARKAAVPPAPAAASVFNRWMAPVLHARQNGRDDPDALDTGLDQAL